MQNITLEQFERQMINMYLDYVNNFLTVERFAQHYNLSIKGANSVIKNGRQLNIESLKA